MRCSSSEIKENWDDRSLLEKFLLISVFCTTLITVILFVFLLTGYHGDDICDTKECVQGSTHILQSIDPSVDPCNNFYEFACGTFMKNSKFTKQRSTLSTMFDKTQMDLRSIITEPKKRKLPKSVQLQRRLYQSCINDPAITQDSNESILKMIRNIGGWPLLNGDSFKEDDFYWMLTMLKASRSGLPYDFFLGISFFDDRNNTKKNILTISPPYKVELLFVSQENKEEKAMIRIAEKLGASQENAESEIKASIDFAKELDKIVKRAWNTSTNIGDRDFKIMPMKHLNNKYVRMPWMKFLSNFTQGITNFSLEDPVLFKGEDYVRDLHYLLNRTPKNVQANYIMWYIVLYYIDYLSPDIRNLYYSLNEPDKKELDRNERCFEISRKHFTYVVESEYIRRTITKDKKMVVKEMIVNIKNEFGEAMEKSTFMDEKTKELIWKRVRDLSYAVGWLDMIFDVEKFEKKLQIDQLHLASDNLINMTTSMELHDLRRSFGLINKPASSAEQLSLVTPILHINAYYYNKIDTLILPGPIVQDFIFAINRPAYMNYGALGSIIGHELTHGFAKPMDTDNTNNYVAWWTNKTIEKFAENVRCVKDAYEEYVKELKGPMAKASDSTLDENIADFTGSNMAYQAYQNYIGAHGTELRLPGLNYTPNQIFWIMSVTFLCTLDDGSENKDAPHAISSFRINGQLRHSPYFSRDFQCPVGSKMNPTKKCNILA